MRPCSRPKGRVMRHRNRVMTSESPQLYSKKPAVIIPTQAARAAAAIDDLGREADLACDEVMEIVLPKIS